MTSSSILTELSIFSTVPDVPESSDAVPRTRGHKKKERTRGQLIAAAVDVIAERGEGFSVSDVTSRAGMSNGTFYNYFDDRDELIDAVVPEVLESFAAESATAVASEDPAHRFATITARAMHKAASEPDMVRVVLRLDAVQRALVADGPLSYLEQDLADGVAAGRFTIDGIEATVDVIVGALLMTARRIVDHGLDEDHLRSVLAQLLRSLGIGADEAGAIAAQAASVTPIDD